MPIDEGQQGVPEGNAGWQWRRQSVSRGGGSGSSWGQLNARAHRLKLAAVFLKPCECR